MCIQLRHCKNRELTTSDVRIASSAIVTVHSRNKQWRAGDFFLVASASISFACLYAFIPLSSSSSSSAPPPPPPAARSRCCWCPSHSVCCCALLFWNREIHFHNQPARAFVERPSDRQTDRRTDGWMVKAARRARFDPSRRRDASSRCSCFVARSPQPDECSQCLKIWRPPVSRKLPKCNCHLAYVGVELS